MPHRKAVARDREPDVLVAFGVGSHRRRSYAIWKEGKPPEFVMEIASVSTWRRDRDEKPAIYESLGVREYFLYDPVGGRLEPRLQGHVLRDGRYRPLRPERLANGERGLRSETLGLWAYLQGPEQALRWHDPVTGKDLEDYKASGRGNGDVSTRVWGRDGPRRSATSQRISSSSMNGWAKMVLQVRSGRIGTTVARRTEPSHGRRSCLRIHPETCEASWPGHRGATSTVTVTRMRPSRAASILINRSSVNRPT